MIEEQHSQALAWFSEHQNQAISWREIKANVEAGPRLVNQAKGIYKPAYTDYALSVRQTLTGPYDDLPITRYPDGTWRFEYFQENPDPALRDREATNRGLMKCMADRVPVGVLIQSKPKPGVVYDVMGLAWVSDWNNGHFILEGGAPELRNWRMKGFVDARAARPAIPEPAGSAPAAFDAADQGDLRMRQTAEIVVRRGQPQFRDALIAAYGGRCAVTGCDAVEALEAAHIAPYRGDHSHDVRNGLLLRADIHTLFDLGLITVDPDRGVLILSKKLEGGSYAALAGQLLARPFKAQDRPSVEALRNHRNWAGL
jgi:hypothetical protein